MISSQILTEKTILEKQRSESSFDDVKKSDPLLKQNDDKISTEEYGELIRHSSKEKNC